MQRHRQTLTDWRLGSGGPGSAQASWSHVMVFAVPGERLPRIGFVLFSIKMVLGHEPSGTTKS